MSLPNKLYADRSSTFHNSKRSCFFPSLLACAVSRVAYLGLTEQAMLLELDHAGGPNFECFDHSIKHGSYPGLKELIN